jgi:signal transduction histidine kinase
MEATVDTPATDDARHQHDALMRSLSHDLRSSPASILALLELQKDPSTALPQDELFSRIEKACHKTLHLTDSFVQLDRAGSQDYRLEEIDFQEIVDEAIDQMWSMAQSRHVYLVSEISGTEFPVRVDRSLITRALTHLMSNAIQCSTAGGQVACSVHAAPGQGTIACSVKDQGHGIALADQARLFRCFEKLEAPGQSRHDGAGLGLAFVKTVIERHHGTVEVVSEPGVGSTFTMILPATPT